MEGFAWAVMAAKNNHHRNTRGSRRGARVRWDGICESYGLSNGVEAIDDGIGVQGREAAT